MGSKLYESAISDMKCLLNSNISLDRISVGFVDLGFGILKGSAFNLVLKDITICSCLKFGLFGVTSSNSDLVDHCRLRR